MREPGLGEYSYLPVPDPDHERRNDTAHAATRFTWQKIWLNLELPLDTIYHSVIGNSSGIPRDPRHLALCNS
jgi:hypothetical protein